MSYIGNERIMPLQINSENVYIRYSAHADGTDFTETWSAGQKYIGFATGTTAPTDKSGYEWALFAGGTGDGADGKGIDRVVLTGINGKDKNYLMYFTDGTAFAYTVTDGEDGRGIESIVQAASDSNPNYGNGTERQEYEIIYTDGTSSYFVVYNGKNGAKGDKGDNYTLTEADKTEIVQSVLNAIPRAEGVAF